MELRKKGQTSERRCPPAARSGVLVSVSPDVAGQPLPPHTPGLGLSVGVCVPAGTLPSVCEQQTVRGALFGNKQRGREGGTRMTNKLKTSLASQGVRVEVEPMMQLSFCLSN